MLNERGEKFTSLSNVVFSWYNQWHSIPWLQHHNQICDRHHRRRTTMRTSSSSSSDNSWCRNLRTGTKWRSSIQNWTPKHQFHYIRLSSSVEGGLLYGKGGYNLAVTSDNWLRTGSTHSAVRSPSKICIRTRRSRSMLWKGLQVFETIESIRAR